MADTLNLIFKNSQPFQVVKNLDVSDSTALETFGQGVQDVFGLNEPGAITNDIITLDVVTSISYQYKATMTEYPIANGADITDHVRRVSDTFTITAIISDYPLIPGLLGSVVSSGVAISDRVADEEARSKRGFDSFINLINEPQPVILVTDLVPLDNLILLEFLPTSTLRTAGSLEFQLMFKKARFSEVETGVVEIDPKTPDGAGKTKETNKPPEPPKAEDATIPPVDVEKGSWLTDFVVDPLADLFNTTERVEPIPR